MWIHSKNAILAGKNGFSTAVKDAIVSQLAYCP
jgi:hypothetical protein